LTQLDEENWIISENLEDFGSGWAGKAKSKRVPMNS
jgi:hypothetical protein